MLARSIFRLRGRVEHASGEPAAEVLVAIVDADPDLDDLIAVGVTEADGSFRVSFTAEAFNQEPGEAEETPDLYVIVSRVTDEGLDAVLRADFGKLRFESEEDLGTIRLRPLDDPQLGSASLRAAPGRGKIVKRIRLDDELVGLAVAEICPIVEKLTGWSGLALGVQLRIIDDFLPFDRARWERALGRKDLSAKELARLAELSRECDAGLAAEWDPTTRTVLLNRNVLETQPLDYLKLTLGHELVHVGQSLARPDIDTMLVAYQHEAWRSLASGTDLAFGPQREAMTFMSNLEGYAEYIESRYLRQIYTHATMLSPVTWSADTRFRDMKREERPGLTPEALGTMTPEQLVERYGSTKRMQYASGAAAYVARGSEDVPAPFDPDLQPPIIPDLMAVLGTLAGVIRAALEKQLAGNIYPLERKCAACGATTRVGTDHRTDRPVPEPDQGGLDGRPGRDAAFITHDPYIEECASCGHLAPNLAVPYPRVEQVREERRELLALPGHAPAALRCLAVANLFADIDPLEEGRWSLRAAWLDEAAGNAEAARPMRRRAGTCLEDAVFQGYALVPERTATSLVLAETFRVGGSYERAFEHAVRGLASAARGINAQRNLLVFEVDQIIEKRSEPLTLGAARAGYDALGDERLKEVSGRFRVAAPLLAPMRLRPRRTFAHPSLPSDGLLEEHALVFAQDHLDPRIMLDLLQEGRPGVWEGVCARPYLLPLLLRATDEPDPRVRKGALATLDRKKLSFDKDVLEGQDAAVDALLRRFDDTDRETIHAVCRIARGLIVHDASIFPRVADRAREALPKWKHDPITADVLEAFVEIAASRARAKLRSQQEKQAQPARPPSDVPIVIGDADRPARTLPEMQFAASLRPCASCGAVSLAPLDCFGAKDRYTLMGPCAHCKAPRKIAFVTRGDPRNVPCKPDELGGNRPSSIITPSELLAELTRILALAPDPAQLEPKLRDRAVTCTRELSKSPPDALGCLEPQNGEIVDEKWLFTERNRLTGSVAPPIDSVLRVLFDEAGPPPTVGALEQALGLVFEEEHVDRLAHGRIDLTATLAAPLTPQLQSVSAKYVVRKPIMTLQALRARPLDGWSVTFKGGSAAVDAALLLRFGAPRAQPPHRVYHTWMVSDEAQGACTIAYAERPS